MKLTLAEPRYLKDSIAIISELVTEGKFKVSQDALELVAMDPANVAMVVFKLLASSFVEYDVGDGKDIAINLNSFKQVLRRAKPNDALTLETSQGKLSITLKSTTLRTFTIPLIDLEDKEQKIPELAFPVIVETSAEVINDAIEDISVVSESMQVICEQQKMTLKGEGDSSQAQVEIEASEATTISQDDPQPAKSKYSIEYLKKMMPAGKIASNMSLLFDNDYPLKLDFKEVDKLQLSFILAPRVENE